MATKNAKNNSKKKSTNGKPAEKQSKRKSVAEKEQNSHFPVRSALEESVRIEIIMTITALVAVLLILSYVNLCGAVGQFINQLMFGLMGVFTYAFPVILFFFVAFYLSNRSNRVAKQKLLSGLAFLFLLTGLIQLISGMDESRKLLDYYIYCSENKCGGGIFGAVIAVPLVKLFGTLGTAVIIVALMIVFLLLLTGKALFRIIRNRGAESWQRKKELHRIREEEYKRMRQEAVQERQENARRIQMVDVVPQGIHNVDSKGRLLSDIKETEENHSFLDVLREKSGIKSHANEKDTIEKKTSVYRQIEMEEVEHQTTKENKPVQEESYLSELERKFAGKGHTVGEIRAKEFDEFRYEQKLPEGTNDFLDEPVTSADNDVEPEPVVAKKTTKTESRRLAAVVTAICPTCTNRVWT